MPCEETVFLIFFSPVFRQAKIFGGRSFSAWSTLTMSDLLNMAEVHSRNGYLVKGIKVYKCSGQITKFPIVFAKKTMLAKMFRPNFSAKFLSLSYAQVFDTLLRLRDFGI